MADTKDTKDQTQPDKKEEVKKDQEDLQEEEQEVQAKEAEEKTQAQAETEEKDQTETEEKDASEEQVDPEKQAESEEQTDPDDLDEEEIEAPDVQEVEVEDPNLIRIAEEDNDKAHWYVVHTYSGRENKVAETLKQRAQTLNLEDKLIKILIPTKEKIQIRKGKRKTVNEKIFPGYMMVNMVMSDDAWLAVRTTQGVTGFVGTSSKPSPLPRHEVEAIQKYMKQATPQYKAEFTEGEAVRITDGPFDDFLGTVKTIDEEKGQVEVLINIFGRETPVELDFLQVEKV